MIQTLVPYRFTTRFMYYLKHGLSEEQPHQLPPTTSRKIISSYVFTQSFSDPNDGQYADEVREQAVRREKAPYSENPSSGSAARPGSNGR